MAVMASNIDIHNTWRKCSGIPFFQTGPYPTVCSLSEGYDWARRGGHAGYGLSPCQTIACGTHLCCGIPIERCGHPSEIGARDNGKEVLGRIGGFWLSLLLGKITQHRRYHWQRSRQSFSTLGTHLPGHKGTEVCWALATILRTGL